MKKVVCLIAVLALTASVFAAEPITITATVNATAKTLTLGYNATGATKPVGFSFIVSATGGKVALAGINKADSFFDVFIDFASDDPAAYQAGADPATGVWSAAHMLAKADEAGAATLPAAVFSISAAELANVATIPATGTICVLTYTCDGTTPIAITFAEDTLRGGIVDTAGVAMTATLPGAVEIPCLTDCLYVGQVFSYAGAGPAVTLTVTQAMVDRWVALGKPNCWCCLAQKAGNGVATNTRVDTGDLNELKQSWNKSSTAVGYKPCADYNLSGRVDTADLNVLKSHWNKTTGGCN